MQQSKNRQWQVCILAFLVLTGATACSKKPASESAENQALTPAEQAIKKQQTDKHGDEYYKSSNKTRVSEENSIIDDVNAETSSSK
jgi:Flp pilus assembly protein TadD